MPYLRHEMAAPRIILNVSRRGISGSVFDRNAAKMAGCMRAVLAACVTSGTLRALRYMPTQKGSGTLAAIGVRPRIATTIGSPADALTAL